MRKFFLTLDLEEWYHLEYVKPVRKDIESSQEFAPKTLSFFKKMKEDGIYLTVFVLNEVAEKHPKLIKEIHELGHEIALHGDKHELVYDLSIEEFKNMIEKSKKNLEHIIGEPILGYRAPCFSMEKHKLHILWDLKFKYDASLIRFRDHSFYNVMDMDDYTKEESLIFSKASHFEFETPTLDILGKSIPISGGGYFRLIPLNLMKLLMRKHWEKEDNFIFYIHPFEIVTDKLNNGSKMGKKNYFRFEVGRKNLERKLDKYIQFLKNEEVEFTTFKRYLENK